MEDAPISMNAPRGVVNGVYALSPLYAPPVEKKDRERRSRRLCGMERVAPLAPEYRGEGSGT